MEARRRVWWATLSVPIVATACNVGTGKGYMAEPLTPDDSRLVSSSFAPSGNAHAPVRRLGQAAAAESPAGAVDPTGGGGRVLGLFRNTYYDFPREDGEGGPRARVMDPACKPIADVSRAFHDSVCVQGSGLLRNGRTISFAKRDCACADVCPRTGQRICFEALDAATFPWGRGATGKPITPLRTVAADTTVLPMGTVLYIPEFDGVPRDEGAVDGCFVVEDRGLRVQGEHVDIFTGHPDQTATLNAQVPSNSGVTVVVDAPKCAYLRR